MGVDRAHRTALRGAAKPASHCNNGAGGTYQVLSSTNLTVPLTNWTVLTNGTFDGSGDFSVTNSVGNTNTRQFYILQVP